MSPSTRDLEERLLNAWPAFHTLILGDWALRLADGYSKRANALTALRHGAVLDPALLAHVEGVFNAAGIAPCIRITPLVAEGVDANLDGWGWTEHETSLGMVAALDPARLGPPDPAMVLDAAPSPAWIMANAAAYGGDKARPDVLARIVALIRPPVVFATLREDGEAVAWGIAVAERGIVTLQDIVVAPERRGRGLARRLVGALLGWGAGRGAAWASLQVREVNAPARALYAALGFHDRYVYTHRVRAQARGAASSAPATINAQAAPSASRASP